MLKTEPIKAILGKLLQIFLFIFAIASVDSLVSNANAICCMKIDINETPSNEEIAALRQDADAKFIMDTLDIKNSDIRYVKINTLYVFRLTKSCFNADGGEVVHPEKSERCMNLFLHRNKSGNLILKGSSSTKDHFYISDILPSGCSGCQRAFFRNSPSGGTSLIFGPELLIVLHN